MSCRHAIRRPRQGSEGLVLLLFILFLWLGQCYVIPRGPTATLSSSGPGGLCGLTWSRTVHPLPHGPTLPFAPHTASNHQNQPETHVPDSPLCFRPQQVASPPVILSRVAFRHGWTGLRGLETAGAGRNHGNHQRGACCGIHCISCLDIPHSPVSLSAVFVSRGTLSVGGVVAGEQREGMLPSLACTAGCLLSQRWSVVVTPCGERCVAHVSMPSSARPVGRRRLATARRRRRGAPRERIR